MKKIITQHLCIYMLIALVVTVIGLYIYQTVLDNYKNTEASQEKLVTVKEKLKSNDEQIEKLEESLGQSALAKTRAFAHMLSLDPALMKDKEALLEICDLLIVDELHVINVNGIIEYSTIDAYIGFDMKSGEQSLPFMAILDDPSLEIVQKPQPNATKGILFQYIGVSLENAPGFVQVGIRPEILENMISNNALDVVLNDFEFGTNGYIFAIDLNTNKVLASKNKSLIGSDAASAGFPDKSSANTGFSTIDGIKGYYVTEEFNNMKIGTFLPSDEYYANRLNQTIIVSFCIFVIFIVLIIKINLLVNKRIVRGIQHISKDLSVIADGNLDIVVNEHGNKEFELLSASINKMVNNIKDNLSRNEQLMQRQKIDMEKNHSLINSIKSICKNIDSVTQETLHNSKSIHKGTEAQETAVDNLHKIMSLLSGQLKESAETSNIISVSTTESLDRLMHAKEGMELLQASITKIADSSLKIEKIIDEIDAIASQTNMLSLNASIEAARAGEMGRGFAVVANQVRELAARSAQAAKETGVLIMNSIQAVKNGQDIAGTAVEDFLSVVTDIEKTCNGIEKISAMSNQQVSYVTNAVAGLNEITGVVENNIIISENSEKTSKHLAAEAEKLNSMVKL